MKHPAPGIKPRRKGKRPKGARLTKHRPKVNKEKLRAFLKRWVEPDNVENELFTLSYLAGVQGRFDKPLEKDLQRILLFFTIRISAILWVSTTVLRRKVFCWGRVRKG